MNASSALWQPVPALPLRFAIESAAPAAIRGAQRLFAPWLVENSDAATALRWRVEADGGATELWRACAPDSSAIRARQLAELLAHVEYASLNYLVAHLPPQWIGLHGALLSRQAGSERRAVVVVGPKEAGKSTLACALWRAGWTLHCDDFTLLDAQSRAHPSARRVSLRNGSRQLLGEALWHDAAHTPDARVTTAGLCFHPHQLAGAAPIVHLPLRLEALIFLGRRGAQIAPAQLQSLTGIEAAFALLPYSSLLLDESGTQLTHERADWGEGLAMLAKRIEPLPLYDLGRAVPAEMVAAIEATVATAG